MTDNKIKGFISNTKVFDNYSKGWEILKSKFWLLILVVLLSALIEFFIRGFGNIFSIIGGLIYEPLSLIIPIILGLGLGYFIMFPIQAGVSWIFLKAARKENFEIDDLFGSFKRNYKNIVLGLILTSIIGIVGFLLFIIPGIIFIIRLNFVIYLLIDKKMKARDAIRTSWKMTKGYSWKIFGMGLVSIPILIAGFLCFFIGMLPAIVWINSANAVLYYSVSLKKK